MMLSLNLDTEAFAARRRTLMERIEAALRPHVDLALIRVGLPGWFAMLERPVEQAFNDVVAEEFGEPSQVIDEMREAFITELTRSLSQAKRSDNYEAQVERITRWVSTATINAATEAAVATDPDLGVGLEWVSMGDEDVRASHREAHGQVVPLGGTFEVEGVQVHYPGQPVGPPSLWLNCRCLARPAMLEQAAGQAETFAADDREHDRTEYPLVKGEAEMPENLTAAAEVDDEVDDSAPEVPEEDLHLPVPWHGVLAPEGTPSGDGRQFAPESLRNRDLPLPLKYMAADAEGHDGSVVVGRIDRIWREDGKMLGEGVFDSSPQAYEAIRQIAEQMIRGVSVDVDDATAALEEESGLTTFSSARIAAATLCAIPAFAEAFVALGTWDDGSDFQPDTRPEVDQAGAETQTFAEGDVVEEDAPQCQYGEEYATHKVGEVYSCDRHMEQAIEDAGEGAEVVDLKPEVAPEDFAPVPVKTKDGPGWITHPKPTKRITDYWVDGVGAAKIGWGAPGDFNRCRVQLAKYVQNPDWLAGLCANLHYRALRVWPGQHHAGRTESMSDTASITASVGLVETTEFVYDADWFREPELSGPTPITVTEEGRIFGHLAAWGTCHIGFANECIDVPRSETDYAYFLTGEVDTDAGPVAVGQISVGGGHARDGLSIRPTIAHYDSTSTAVADVTVGEDNFGVWVAGAIRPDAPAEKVRDLRASALSGDWREVIVKGRPSMELVAALSVNVPGFPIPRTSAAWRGGRAMSLVAAGIPQVEAEREGGAFDPADLKAAVKDALAEMQMDEERKARAARSRKVLRDLRAHNARKRLTNSM